MVKNIRQESSARRKSPRGERKKLEILDAAEKLFAERGMAGASLRDIASLAGADLGSITYHFTSKENLFNQVLARRAESGAARIRLSFENAIRKQGHISLELILSNYARSSLWLFGEGREQWIHYSRMVLQPFPEQNPGTLNAAISEHYGPVRNYIIDCLCTVMPGVPREDVAWCFGQFEGALTPLFKVAYSPTDDTRLQREIRLFERNLVPFYLAGFKQLAACATQSDLSADSG